MLFKIIYPIANWFYRTYYIVLAKIAINKLVRMDVAKRREKFLTNGFRMISYHEADGVQVRVYQHKSGIKITDRVTHLTLPVSQSYIKPEDGDSIELYGLLGLLTRPYKEER